MPDNINGYIIIKEQSFDVGNLQNMAVSMVFESVEVNVTDCQKVQVTQYAKEEIEEDWHFKSYYDSRTLEVTSAYKTDIYMDVAPPQKYVIELPKIFAGCLTVSNVSGEIRLNGDGEWRELTLKSASDIIQQGSIIANALTLKSVSGSIRGDKIVTNSYSISTTGNIISADSLSGTGTIVSQTGTMNINELIGGNHELSNKSGPIKVNNFEGDGSIKSTSSLIQANVNKLTGNLSLHTVNGPIRVGFGQSVSAHIDARCTSGTIQSDISTVNVSGGSVNTGFAVVNIGVNKKASGTVGDKPKWTVKMQTTTGAISIVKQST